MTNTEDERQSPNFSKISVMILLLPDKMEITGEY